MLQYGSCKANDVGAPALWISSFRLIELCNTYLKLIILDGNSYPNFFDSVCSLFRFYLRSYTMQCNAMQCNAMQGNAMQYNAMQCNTIQYNTIQYNTIQ